MCTRRMLSPLPEHPCADASMAALESGAQTRESWAPMLRRQWAQREEKEALGDAQDPNAPKREKRSPPPKDTRTNKQVQHDMREELNRMTIIALEERMNPTSPTR